MISALACGCPVTVFAAGALPELVPEAAGRLFDRMLGTGTLIIGSASEDPLEFDDIPKVEKVHSLLYHQVFDTDQAGRDDQRGGWGR